MSVSLLLGDARRVLATLPSGHFRCAVTSPPYWEQREYLPADHRDKALEIGHEATPAAYVATLVEVFRELRRTLTDDGTLWINLGDKYANDPGGYVAGGTKSAIGRRMAKRGASCGRLGRGRVDLPAKSLIGLPWRVAFALQDDGWILRSEIIWEKPNAMPHPVADRPTTSHEHLFLFSRASIYHYDADAIREPHRTPTNRRATSHGMSQRAGQPAQTWGGEQYHPLGRNARSVWSILLEHGDGVHVAPMASGLARRCILAGSMRGDHVLDPFGGRGTVGRVAEDEGRHATLIDLDDRAIEQARAVTSQGGLYASRAGGAP